MPKMVEPGEIRPSEQVACSRTLSGDYVPEDASPVPDTKEQKIGNTKQKGACSLFKKEYGHF